MNEITEKKADRDRRVSSVLEKYSSSAEITAELTEEERDRYFMRTALELARLAYAEGEVPVGCIVVREGRIISGDFNGRETFRDALFHAESSAIAKASATLGGWRLVGCTLYVTLEPCPMCAGACWAARVPRVVIGAKDARAGALGSLINLNSYPLNHKPQVTFGVLEEECRSVIQSFFSSRRLEKNSESEKSEKSEKSDKIR